MGETMEQPKCSACGEPPAPCHIVRNGKAMMLCWACWDRLRNPKCGRKGVSNDHS
jgi:hypothetical protein